MAFKVEDGTGLADSNSYATYAELQGYTTLRGITISGHVQGVWENYLVRATDYIDQRWGPWFKGSRLLTTQALGFPRADAVDSEGEDITGIPVKLKNATIEYALILGNGGSLFNTPDVDTTGQKVASIRRVVGPIEKTVSYNTKNSPQVVKQFPIADSLMREFVEQQGGVIRA